MMKLLLNLYADVALLLYEEKNILIKIFEDLENNFGATICETVFSVGFEIEYKSDDKISSQSKNYSTVTAGLERFCHQNLIHFQMEK